MSIPVIDPSVRYVGASHLRTLKVEALQGLGETLVIQDGDELLAVVLPIKVFMEMQRRIQEYAVPAQEPHLVGSKE